MIMINNEITSRSVYNIQCGVLRLQRFLQLILLQTSLGVFTIGVGGGGGGEEGCKL